MTSTPRTDAEAATTSLRWNAESKWVLADFARTLERDLAAMTAELDAAWNALTADLVGLVDELTDAERAEIRAHKPALVDLLGRR